MDGAKARTNGGNTLSSCRTSPLKPKAGLSGPPALFFLYYNFCRVHSTLRVTPAMEAGLADHVWSIEEMCELLPKTPNLARQTERKLTFQALAR